MVLAYQRVAKSRPVPTAKTLQKMARALEVPIYKPLCNCETLLKG
jgi:transcriptional regulator with XRE-family HTH domain